MTQPHLKISPKPFDQLEFVGCFDTSRFDTVEVGCLEILNSK